MPQIMLTAEQARVMSDTRQRVEICDPDGFVLCSFEPDAEAQIIAKAKRGLASNQPRYSSVQVSGFLRALEEEWARTGGFDEAYLRTFLNRLKAGVGS